MTNIQDTYVNSLLADATYAINPDVGTGTDLANLQLLKDRMTPGIARYIDDNFTVITHIETDDIFGSGFDATVWKDNAGKTYVSNL